LAPRDITWQPAARDFSLGHLAQLFLRYGMIGGVGAMFIGSAAMYAIAVPWLAVTAFGGDLQLGVEKGLLPFLFWDAVKLALAAAAFPAAWWIVGRRPGES
jgi:biotin transport system substrate-specific component